MSVSFCHASAPLVAEDFGDFVDMVRANEVNTSSSNVSRIAFMLGWDLDAVEGGEIPLAELPQFIENCDNALNCEGPHHLDTIIHRRIAQLRALAKQAIMYGEPIQYG